MKKILLFTVFCLFAWSSFGQSEMKLDSLWKNLLFVDGGCMTGGQYYSKPKHFSEGSVLGNQKWQKLFSFKKSEITPFLISKFSDTTRTKIHTCPFFWS
tara:strand:- start:19020 stop:19316 length:297 start_codon:yes stop_codon:yes gene_type:complete